MVFLKLFQVLVSAQDPVWRKSSLVMLWYSLLHLF